MLGFSRDYSVRNKGLQICKKWNFYVIVADETFHQPNDRKRKQTSSSSGIEAARGKPSPTLAIHVMNNIVSEFMKICQRLGTTQSHYPSTKFCFSSDTGLV